MAEYTNITIQNGGLRGFQPGDIIKGGTVYTGGLMTANQGGIYNLNIAGGFVEVTYTNVSGCQITDNGVFNIVAPPTKVYGTVVVSGTMFLRGGQGSKTTIKGPGAIELVEGGSVEYDSLVVSGGIQQVKDGVISGSILQGVFKGQAGNQMLERGAKAFDTIISSGGNQAVSAGASAVRTQIHAYGQQHVQQGGYASSVVMYAGDAPYLAAYQLVEGLVYDTKVYAYGDHFVRFGGKTFHSEIYNLAWQTIDAGGIASGTIVYSGGLQGMYGASNGYSCGKAYDTIVSNGGMQAVESGYAENTTLRGGVQQVWDLGSAVKTNVSGGAQLVAGYAVSNYVCNGGNQKVVSSAFDAKKNTAASKGYALSNVISNGYQWVIDGVASKNSIAGGTQTLQGGTAIDNVLSGGTQWIATGKAQNTTINSGAQILQGGSALTNRLTGANQTVWGGAYTSDNVIKNGNQQIAEGNGGKAVKNVIYNGNQLIAANNSAVNTDIYGGMVKIYNNGYASDTELKRYATMENWGGMAKDLTVSAGSVCDFWQSGQWSGTMTIGGQVSLHDGSGSGNIVFEITQESSQSYMLDAYQSNANYAVSVSRYAECGVYTLIKNATSFAKNVSVYAGDRLCGTISLTRSCTYNNRTYSLSQDRSGKLVLSVSGREAENAQNGVDSDSRADVIMTHTRQGYAGAWLIGDDQTASWGNLSNLDASQWKLFDLGSVAPGSKNDIFLYSESQNSLSAWSTNASGNVSKWQKIASFNDNMDILGLGDFNGDGQSDVLLRSIYGDVGCWFTSGEKTGWKRFQSLGKEWKLAAVGDFNADGRDDVVLTHDAGFAGCYLTQADGTVKWSDLDKLNGNQVVGAGDFNGDGIDDVLWKNKNGYYGAWLVENGNAKGWIGLGTIKNDRTVEQIADFDGDGTDDLRIRTDYGDIGILLVKGSGNLEWHYYGSVGKEWSTSLAATV